MFCSKILVAYDPSVEIHILYSVALPIQTAVYGNAFQEIEENMLNYGKEIVTKAEERLAGLPNTTHTFVTEGSPIRGVLDHAKQNQCDLIIMGSRGLSGFKEFLGSTSHSIVQHSPVPVLLVK